LPSFGGHVRIKPRERKEKAEGPVFEPLKDPKVFRQVRVDKEAGTVAWPNGADLDPDVLYIRSVPLKLPGEEAARA